MSLFHAVVLAVVQGLTEFLPVSSSAHLILIPWLLHWPDGGMAFDVALHAGTLFAVILYFLGTWVSLTLNGLGIRYPAAATEQQFRLNQRLFWFLVAGTIPGAVVGFLFEGFIDRTLRNPALIACALIALGLVMAAADSISRLDRHMEQVTLNDSLIVGSAQALALFPGVSRSGITIVAGLWRNMTRETAARFSFLLATPLIAGAALKEVPELLRLRHTGAIDISLSTIFISIAVSAIVGYAVIAFFLRYLQTRTLKIFVVYRIAFGIVVLLVWFLYRGTAR
jgi:undecaprenyl-diphosphatase